ncbi:MAG: hypothetical protein AAF927_03765 [Bacteroidota bacterium]
MRVYKSLERKSWVLGLPLNQIGLLLCLFLVLTVGGSLLSVLLALPWWYYLASLALVLSLYLLLRKAAKRQHPDFLLSFLSYRYFQPDEIDYVLPPQTPDAPSDDALSGDHP